MNRAGLSPERNFPRSMCHWFCLMYSASCLLTLTGGYSLLVLGRVAGGLATSLLFSTFESWMVAEHRKRVREMGKRTAKKRKEKRKEKREDGQRIMAYFPQGFPSDWLSKTFSIATLGNGIVACLAGVVANGAAALGGGHHRKRAYRWVKFGAANPTLIVRIPATPLPRSRPTLRCGRGLLDPGRH